jgi:hypothetical protein
MDKLFFPYGVDMNKDKLKTRTPYERRKECGTQRKIQSRTNASAVVNHVNV